MVSPVLAGDGRSYNESSIEFVKYAQLLSNLKYDRQTPETKPNESDLITRYKQICKTRAAQLAAAEEAWERRQQNTEAHNEDEQAADVPPQFNEFPSFDDNQTERIRQVLQANGDREEGIITKFNITIRWANIQTLTGTNWLDDEVINFYMNLLMERSEMRSESEGLPRVYVFSTFFMTRLLASGYAGVRRWTKNVDIFGYDMIPVPVHVGGVHWCMAIIDFRHRTIRYYDSMGSKNPDVLNKMAEYLVEEARDKKGQAFDMGGWSLESMTNIPLQQNQCDCGVFSCSFAEALTRNGQIQFTQENVPWLRLKMVLEIVQGELIL